MARKASNSRPAQWADAVTRAREAHEKLESAFDDLDCLRQEYEEWRDNLPDNLQSSPLSEKLNEVADLDFSGTLDEVREVIDQAENADLPRGFGRD
jgi:hypothetical protein